MFGQEKSVTFASLRVWLVEKCNICKVSMSLIESTITQQLNLLIEMRLRKKVAARMVFR